MSMISEYLQWLSPLKMWDHHHQVFANWQEGTGAWLLEEDAVQQWITGNKRVLFCHGIRKFNNHTFYSKLFERHSHSLYL